MNGRTKIYGRPYFFCTELHAYFFFIKVGLAKFTRPFLFYTPIFVYTSSNLTDLRNPNLFASWSLVISYNDSGGTPLHMEFSIFFKVLGGI